MSQLLVHGRFATCLSVTKQSHRSAVPLLGVRSVALCMPSLPSVISRNLVSKRTVTASAAEGTAAEAPDAAKAAQRKSDLIKGCKIILQELKGLDFSRTEARLYFKLSARPPKGTPKDFDVNRARACLEQLLESDSEAYAGPTTALEDIEAMVTTQAMLSEIWRWRRRGGGMNDEDNRPPHQYALQEIQSLEKEDIDRITSSVLDNLPITDAQKSEMAGAVEQATMAGINGAVWGSLVMCLVFLVGFNFLRSA